MKLYIQTIIVLYVFPQNKEDRRVKMYKKRFLPDCFLVKPAKLNMTVRHYDNALLEN